ncbi:hypothetical protein CFE70_000474 [Pyrenophora teres f. teres 0-1]
MNVTKAVEQLRQGQKPQWPTNSESLEFAQSLDASKGILETLRSNFIVPSKAQIRRKTLKDDAQTAHPASKSEDEAIYFCGNSLGLQPRAVGEHLNAYLKTWGSIVVGGHFTALEDSPLTPFQDMAAACSRKMADIVGASPSEIVAMNTLTINLHLMMAAFYKPTEKKHKIMCEWRPFPSDWYAIESQIEWHGLDPKKSMLLVEPDGGHIMTTDNILRLITENADDLALIMLPGIQYYSGQLLDIPTITAHARKHNIIIGWDLAHAAGNVELRLHDWDVDFACWCTYKYMNAGAGAIAGTFIHEKHGNNDHYKGLKGWYGHDKSSRFLMDNKFVPTPGAQGFQCSNPSIVDLTCLSGALSVFEKTSMADLRSRSLLLTAYAEHLLAQIAARNSKEGASPFQIITPSDPRFRGAQLSVLLPEDIFDDASAALVDNGVVCDKRKPGIIRVAPVPLDEVLKSGEVAPEYKKAFEARPVDITGADVFAIRASRAEHLARLRHLYKIPGPIPKFVKETLHEIPTQDGSTINVKIYQPVAGPPNGGSPLIMMYHEGGWSMGDLTDEDLNCRMFTRDLGAVCVNVEYRLAPEHKFPVGVNDCWDALKWCLANSDWLGATPSRGVLVGGASAGGNIAAVLALLSRDRKLDPPITGQYLCVPALLPDTNVPAHLEHLYQSREINTNDPVLKLGPNMIQPIYDPDPKSPLWDPFNHADGHRNVARAFFQVGGLDPLRDEAVLYDRVLRESGVLTRFELYPGYGHMFWTNYPELEASSRFVEDTLKGVRWLLES